MNSSLTSTTTAHHTPPFHLHHPPRLSLLSPHNQALLSSNFCSLSLSLPLSPSTPTPSQKLHFPITLTSSFQTLPPTPLTTLSLPRTKTASWILSLSLTVGTSTMDHRSTGCCPSCPQSQSQPWASPCPFLIG